MRGPKFLGKSGNRHDGNREALDELPGPDRDSMQRVTEEIAFVDVPEAANRRNAARDRTVRIEIGLEDQFVCRSDRGDSASCSSSYGSRSSETARQPAESASAATLGSISGRGQSAAPVSTIMNRDQCELLLLRHRFGNHHLDARDESLGVGQQAGQRLGRPVAPVGRERLRITESVTPADAAREKSVKIRADQVRRPRRPACDRRRSAA